MALKATGLSSTTGPDAGTVAVLLRLAAATDAIDANGLNPAGKLDNVTIPTYLKYADALGLTPAARAAAAGTPIESELREPFGHRHHSRLSKRIARARAIAGEALGELCVSVGVTTALVVAVDDPADLTDGRGRPWRYRRGCGARAGRHVPVGAFLRHAQDRDRTRAVGRV